MGNIVSKECKFVLHCPISDPENDIHIVKEIITYEDGKVEPNLNIIRNFKRPFWITKKHYQNHEQKKESEEIDKLDMFTETQSNLYKGIASRLGQRYITAKSMRDVIKSQYLYGTDIDSKAIIKKIYKDKFPNAITPNSLSVLDIETDIDNNDITIISVASHHEVYVCVVEKILKGRRDVISQLEYLYKKHIPKTELNSKIKPVFDIVKTERELLINTFKKIHEYKTDFIAVWNIDFDVPVIIEACKRNELDPKDLFSHPSIPNNLKYFEYKQGSKVKLTESGVHKPINPEEQWHIVLTPSYSYWIDAMCAHRYIRVGGKSVSGGYSLNNILEKELGKDMKKLKFEDENTYKLIGADWHRYMLNNKPLEYIIYNAWDTMSILELDNKTKDLCTSISALIGISSYDIFNSGPKKIIDALHFFYIENKRVLGTKGAKQDEDNILGLSDWIMILESGFMKDDHGKVILEDPNMRTNVRGNLADYDAVSSYPSDTLAANVSKDTTSRELISIQGFEKNEFIKQNINLFFGKVNSIEYCTTMLNFPTLEDLSNNFRKEKQ